MSKIKKCPNCQEALFISEYCCPECKTSIRGNFPIEDSSSMFDRFSDEERYFILVFLQCGGVIQDVERVMGISYPTVKSKLKEIQRKLEGNGFSESEGIFDKTQFKRDMKEFKIKLKQHIRGQVRDSLHHQFSKAFHTGFKDEESDEEHDRPCCHEPEEKIKETASKHEENERIKAVIDRLESGEMNFESALDEIKKIKQ